MDDGIDEDIDVGAAGCAGIDGDSEFKWYDNTGDWWDGGNGGIAIWRTGSGGDGKDGTAEGDGNCTDENVDVDDGIEGDADGNVGDVDNCAAGVEIDSIESTNISL